MCESTYVYKNMQPTIPPDRSMFSSAAQTHKYLLFHLSDSCCSDLRNQS